MKQKLTPKQEKFCLVYIETGNASEAYRRAYNTSKMKTESVNRKAFEVLENVNITARVEEIYKTHQKRHDVSIDSLTQELTDAAKFAKEMENPSALIQAIIAMAKLHGFMQKRVSGDVRHTYEIAETSQADQWIAEAYEKGRAN